MHTRLLPALLALSLSLPVQAPPAFAATSGGDPDADALRLYESGKFAQAEAIFGKLVVQDQTTNLSRLTRMAHDWLFLARAQAAQKKWQEARDSFQRALSLSQAADMQRTFIDEARSGLAEAQAKLGLAEGDSQSLSPLPVSVVRHAAEDPGNFRRFNQFTWSALMRRHNNQDPAETEYLLRSAVHFAEETSGKLSAEAALANLDLTTFYCNLHLYREAQTPADFAAKIFPQLPPEAKRQVSPTMLETATACANSGQLLLASMLMQPVTKYAPKDSVNAPELATKLNVLADAFALRQQYSQAEALSKQAVALLERTAPDNDKALATQRTKLAALYMKENKPAAAAELYEMSLPVLSEAGQPRTYIDCCVEVVKLYLRQNDLPKAKSAAQKLQHAIELGGGNADRSWLPSVLLASGEFAREGDLKVCRDIYTAAINCREPVSNAPGVNTYFVDSAVQGLVSQLEQMGQIKEAENVYLTQLQADRTPLGETEDAIDATANLALFYSRHDMTAELGPVLDNLVALCTKFGRRSRYFNKLEAVARGLQADKKYAQSIALSRADIKLSMNDSASPDLHQVTEDYTRIATAAEALGDRASAVQSLNEALQSVTRGLPDSISSLVPRLQLAVDKEIDEGKLSLATQLASQLGQLQRSRINNWDSSALLQSSLLSIANNFQSAGMNEEAQTVLKDALATQIKMRGPSSIEAAGVMQTLARSLSAAGKAEEARVMQDGANAINDAFNRQQRGERNAYKPFAPLSETMRNARLRTLPPDSST